MRFLLYETGGDAVSIVTLPALSLVISRTAFFYDHDGDSLIRCCSAVDSFIESETYSLGLVFRFLAAQPMAASSNFPN